MQLDHARFHLGVFGGSGTGKTTYGLKFVAHSPARCRFLFDAEGEFSGKMQLRPARNPDELGAAVPSGWVCFDPHFMFPGDLEAAIAFFAAFTLAACDKIGGRKFFVVDELGQYVTGHLIPKPLKTLVQSGRRYGIDGIFMGQAPNELHNTVRVQLSEVCCFQLTDENALEYPIKFGFNPDKVRALQSSYLQPQPGNHWICRNNAGDEKRG